MIRSLWAAPLRGAVPAILAGVLALASPAALAGASESYEDAAARFARDDYRGAVVSLQSALQSDPRHLPSLVLLGKAQLRMGNGDAAAETLKRARAAGADDAQTLVHLGRAYIQQGRPDLALSEIVAEGQPEDRQIEILTLHGDAHLAAGRVAMARATFERALKLDPVAPEPRMGLARAALVQGRVYEAGAYATRALNVAPQNPRVWYLIAEIRRLSGNLSKALPDYVRALELEPGYVDARVSKTAVLIDLGRDDDALAEIALLKEQTTQHPQVTYLEALLLARRGDMEASAKALDTVAQRLAGVDPDTLNKSAPALLLAGVVANALGQDEQAIRHLEKFLSVEPQHRQARQLLGAVLVRKGLGARAVELLAPAVRPGDYSEDPLLLGTLAAAYRQVGQPDAAAAALERALKDLPPERLSSFELELARVLVDAGRTPRARQLLDAVVARGGREVMEAQMLAAKLDLREGRAEQALEAARAALAAQPDNLDAMMLEAGALLAGGDAGGAATRYRDALALDAARIPTRHGLAAALTALGDTPGAIEQYSAILEADPKDIGALDGLAGVAEREGRTDDAVRWLEKVRAIDAKALRAQLRLIRILLAEGRVDAALDSAERLAAARGDHSRAHEALGFVQLAKGDTGAARASLDKAASVESITHVQLVRIAGLQIQAGDLDGARKSFRRALLLNPGFVPAHAGIVEIDIADGRLDEALVGAQRLQRDHPELSIGARLEGDLYTAQRRFNDAVRAYERAQQAQPSGDGAIRLYRALSRAGRAGEGVKALEAWTTDHPQDTQAARTLASAYLAEGQMEAATAAHEQLIGRLPDDVELLNNLAWLYQSRGDSRALETAARASELAPNDVATQDTYGWVLIETGQPEKGLAVLREAQARASEEPWVKLHIAMALHRLGRTEEARSILEELLRTGRPFEGARQARALLDRLTSG